MDPLITICARSGSQGVKNKNIRPLLGRPLIAYSIDCALRWGGADRVVVSTDSEDDCPGRKGARGGNAIHPSSQPGRRGRSQDGSGSTRASPGRAGDRQAYQVVIDLDVTAPLRHVSDVENAFNLLITLGPLTVFSVVNARKNPYYNVVEADSEGFVHVAKEPVGRSHPANLPRRSTT